MSATKRAAKHAHQSEVLKAFGGDESALAEALQTMVRFQDLMRTNQPKMEGLTRLPTSEQVLAGLRIIAAFGPVAAEAQAVIDKATK